MKLRLAFVFAVLGLLGAGCTSLARGGAAEVGPSSVDDDEDSTPDTGVAASKQSGPPGQMDVAWTDNGIPIRRLTGPGAPQEMKVPESHPKQNGTPPPANATATPNAQPKK